MPLSTRHCSLQAMAGGLGPRPCQTPGLGLGVDTSSYLLIPSLTLEVASRQALGGGKPTEPPRMLAS